MNNFSTIPGYFAESMTTILWVGGVFANIWKVINDKVTFTSLEHVHWALWLLRFIKLCITTICHFFRNMRSSHLFFKKTLQIIEFGLLSTFLPGQYWKNCRMILFFALFSYYENYNYFEQCNIITLIRIRVTAGKVVS